MRDGGFGLGIGEVVLGRLAAWPVCSPELRIKQLPSLSRQGTASSDGLHRARRHHSLFFFFLFPQILMLVVISLPTGVAEKQRRQRGLLIEHQTFGKHLGGTARLLLGI